jgi:CrcB protein
MLRECLAIAAGGAIGSLSRYALTVLFSLMGGAWLPIATLTANALGCLAIGWLAQWSIQQEATNHWGVIGVRVGLLGGLTTFSTFAIDVLRLWQTDRIGFSVLLTLAHLVIGFGCVAIGIWIAKQMVTA